MLIAVIPHSPQLKILKEITEQICIAATHNAHNSMKLCIDYLVKIFLVYKDKKTKT